MKIVVGAIDKSTSDFANKLKGRVLIVDRLCEIKQLKKEVEVYVPFAKLMKAGNFANTAVLIDELLLTLNISCLYYLPSENQQVVKDLCTYYKVKVLTNN